nr:ribosome-inactivating family protein [Streptacidiphilus sp. P02-A3a]
MRGFTNAAGTTYQFNDTDYVLTSYLDRMGALPAGTGANLSFGSNYNSMVQAAGRSRANMSISYEDFTSSILNLANATNPYGDNQQREVARSLMLMIQLTSEAARFNDVYGIGAAITGTDAHYNGLPTMQQYLENSWQRMSQYAVNVTQNPGTPPVAVNGVGTLSSWSDASRYLAMLVGNLNLPQEGPAGNWKNTEL